MSDFGPGEPPRSTPIGGPPPPGYPSSPPPGYGAPPPPAYGQPPFAQPGWTAPPQKRGTNGFAIASLVCGLLWCFAIGSVLAVVFAFVAFSQIKRTQQSGRGMAIAGLVLGLIGVVATIVSVILIATQADKVLDGGPGERDDVELVSCEPAENGDASAQMLITNDSSKRSQYLITVEFTDADGDEFTVTNEFDAIGPGETFRGQMVTERDLGDDYDCRIDAVNRFSDEG